MRIAKRPARIDLELELKLDRIEHQWQLHALEATVEDLQESWWERVISDPRLWFIAGAAAGIMVAE